MDLKVNCLISSKIRDRYVIVPRLILILIRILSRANPFPSFHGDFKFAGNNGIKMLCSAHNAPKKNQFIT